MGRAVRNHWGDQSLILDRIQITDKGCWEWTHGRYKFGYGRIEVAGKKWHAHRLAWTLWNGEIERGLCVLHKCDNPPCCNPEHLYLGTHKDNIRDAIVRGRWSADKLRGPKSVRSPRVNKLTQQQVIEIYESVGPLRDTAEKYGVSVSCISTIRRGLRKSLITKKEWTRTPNRGRPTNS